MGKTTTPGARYVTTCLASICKLWEMLKKNKYFLSQKRFSLPEKVIALQHVEKNSPNISQTFFHSVNRKNYYDHLCRAHQRYK